MSPMLGRTTISIKTSGTDRIQLRLLIQYKDVIEPIGVIPINN